MAKQFKRPAANPDVADQGDSPIAKIPRKSDHRRINPNHHLWPNGRLWWIAFTVHRGHLQERVRFSLGTADVEEARQRRDEVFALYEQAAGCRISIRLKRPLASKGSGRRKRRNRRDAR